MVGESRGTTVIWLVAGVLGVVALMRLTASGDDPGGGEPVRVDRSPPGAAAGAGRGAAGGGDRLFVHVAGAVRRPGLVRVPAGSRVAAAVARAGGPSRRADLTGVNLAAQVDDGQQVVVPAAGAGPGMAGAAGPGAAAGAGAAPGAKPS